MKGLLFLENDIISMDTVATINRVSPGRFGERHEQGFRTRIVYKNGQIIDYKDDFERVRKSIVAGIPVGKP